MTREHRPAARLLLVIAVAALAAVGRLASGQCNINTELQFKPKAAQDGTPSYIFQAGLSGPTVFYENPRLRGRALPPVIIQAVDAAGTRPLDLTKDGSLVICTADPPLRMGGSSVELNRGVALFDSLSILEETRPGLNYSLTFSMTTSTGATYSVQSPRVVMVTRDDTTVRSIRFKNFGYFIRQGVSKAIPVNVTLPPWWIECIGRTGYPVPATGTSIRLRPRGNLGTIVPNTLFTGADSVEFSNVAYYPPTNLLQYNDVVANGIVFDFVALIAGSPAVDTGSLSIVQEISRNRFMAFDRVNSFIRYDNEGATAVLNIFMPPIIIQLFTSQLGPDASNTGIVILATSAQASLSGAEALVIRGVATFTDLTFVDFAPRSAVITFSTVLPDGTPAKLYSGAISVTDSAIKASHVRFQSDSRVSDVASPYAVPATPCATCHAGGPGLIFTLPTVRVFFVDSADRYDLTAHYARDASPTAQRIELMLQLDPPDPVFSFVTPSDALRRPDYGTVVWDNVRITTSQASNSTFSLRVFDPSLIRKTLVSSKLLLLDEGASVASQLNALCTFTQYCPLRLQFANEFGTRSSSVPEPDVPLFTTAGSPMPRIVLSLVDAFGPISERVTDITAANAPRVIAYTVDPDAEPSSGLETASDANIGSFRNGEYVFECLRLKSATGLVRINFVAMSRTTSGLIYEGLGRLRTGFTTVLASPLAGYGVRFASAGLLQYAGQRTSGVVGVALRPIVLEVVNSQNQHDTTDSTVEVRAATSTGEVSPTVVAQKGLINFTLVQFLTGSENPTVTFTVLSSSNPLPGQTLKSGPVLLSTLPIPLYEMTFDDSRGSLSMVRSPFQAVEVPTWNAAPITVVLVVRDSAHETEPDLGGYPVVVDVFSYDANIPRTSYAFPPNVNSLTINTVIPGVRPGNPIGGPVYLRFRVAQGPALLVGRTLVAGPIQLAGTGASCGGGGGTQSEVIAEFRETQAALSAALPTKSSQIAQALGVEPARVIITPKSQVVRTGHLDLRTYAVSKASVAFLDPLRTSTIRKSRSDLAQEFLQIRPACDLPELKLWNVYSTELDRDCDQPAFITGIAIAKQCTRKGVLPMCECYENGVIREQGTQCADVPALLPALVGMCMEIQSSCQQSGIQTVCSGALLPKRSNMIWAWSTLGAIGFASITGYILYKRRDAKARKTLTLTGGAG